MKISIYLILTFIDVSLLIPTLPAQVTFPGIELLSRPTDHSVTVNVVANTAMQAYFEYGTTSETYTSQTAIISSSANDPIVAIMDDLLANTRYYYCMRYSTDGGSTWESRSEHSFHTPRQAGSTFAFAVTTDSHVNIMLGNAAIWTQTLTNVANDNPDFLLDLGDTFAMDYVTSESGARNAYITQRSSSFFGLVSHSASIFIALGNHEQEEG
ncbi:MAG: hypothetical protein EHM72_10225 [Calditrichaeota bacterium]|nr:MAG: hypothetical protein EHM72_10225 [Calditrichota bacterium]